MSIPPSPPPAAQHPASDDGVAAATVGTAMFAVALAASLLWRDQLAEGGHGWWVWTFAGGVVVGLLFRAFASHRARAYRAHAAAEARSSRSGRG